MGIAVRRDWHKQRIHTAPYRHTHTWNINCSPSIIWLKYSLETQWVTTAVANLHFVCVRSQEKCRTLHSYSHVPTPNVRATRVWKKKFNGLICAGASAILVRVAKHDISISISSLAVAQCDKSQFTRIYGMYGRIRFHPKSMNKDNGNHYKPTTDSFGSLEPRTAQINTKSRIAYDKSMSIEHFVNLKSGNKIMKDVVVRVLFY